MIRQIVRIDETKCDGCGLCIPSCHEGALRLVNGKARLVSDRLCDGLGACLGHCPQGAITIENRDADPFEDPAAALAMPQAHPAPGHRHGHGPCPGTRLQHFSDKNVDLPRGDSPASPAVGAPSSGGADRGGQLATPSELTHWPIQLRLLPVNAPVLNDASVLIAADCVPVAYADFQPDLLRGRAILLACPKLDDLAGHVEKLTAIFTHNPPREVLVARMEVPCCGGLVQAVLEARRRSGTALPVQEVVISVRGEVTRRRELAFDPPTSCHQ